MSFQVRKITPEQRPPTELLRLAAKIMIIVLAVLVVGGIAYAIQAEIRGKTLSFNIPSLINAIGGQDLKTDQLGKTNLLLMGQGGGYHSGGTLTDALMVASYDHGKRTVAMVSIPRDLYVRAGSGATMRINQAYDYYFSLRQSKTDAVREFGQLIGKITGLDMQYYVKIDFQAFVETIDTLGGIDVDVPKRIVDNAYPVESSDGVFVRNEIFIVDQGRQHMDGKTALKYVRSRHSTSDFDRSQRQQLVLIATKEKAEQLNYLTSPTKVRQLYSAISHNIETDIGVQEMIRGAYLASKFDRSNVVMVGLTDNTGRPGGVLYPPDRSLTGGASVLSAVGARVGSDDYGSIRRFVDVVVSMPEIWLEKVPIVISNGTRRSGLAQRAKEYLERYGFTVISTSNNKERLERTKIVVSKNFLMSKTVEYLPMFFQGEVTARPIDPNGEVGNYIEIILGENVAESRLTKN